MAVDQLVEAEQLALSVLSRLEAGDPLATVALSAQRLAHLIGDVKHQTWIAAEISGGEGTSRPPNGWTEVQLDGLALFLSLRKIATVSGAEEATDHWERGRPIPKKGKGLYSTLAQLESVEKPQWNVIDRASADTMVQGQLIYLEGRRVLVLIRQKLHEWTTGVQDHVRTLRTRTELFGLDAPTVFTAGGELLAELGKAVDSLSRPGMDATAAIQARTALITLGRELHKGDSTHTSPITGETHQVTGERNRVHALLDVLWVNAPADRRVLLEAAHEVVDTAYELGSKAKNPTAITHAEATEAVKGVYTVAHAICFGGGFPPLQV